MHVPRSLRIIQVQYIAKSPSDEVSPPRYQQATTTSTKHRHLALCTQNTAPLLDRLHHRRPIALHPHRVLDEDKLAVGCDHHLKGTSAHSLR
jgi:hypothetical protein